MGTQGWKIEVWNPLCKGGGEDKHVAFREGMKILGVMYTEMLTIFHDDFF